MTTDGGEGVPAPRRVLFLQTKLHRDAQRLNTSPTELVFKEFAVLFSGEDLNAVIAAARFPLARAPEP